jgi:hypothetical protein
MNTATEKVRTDVPPEEVARRIAEFRQAMAERLAHAVVVYHEPHQPCPWGCGLRILGIDFHLEKLIADESQRSKMLRDWWTGPGLVARCPRCRRHVAFEVLQKRTVPTVDSSISVLPDNWHEIALVYQRG